MICIQEDIMRFKSQTEVATKSYVTRPKRDQMRDGVVGKG